MEAKEKQLKDLFVTYAWDNEDHQEWVYNFVNYIRENGIEAEMDLLVSQKETATDFMKMMHLAMTDYKKVIIVLSPKYKERAESFTGGVGNEFSLIISDIINNTNKYILVSPYGRNENNIPLAFKNRAIETISTHITNDEKQKLFAKLLDKKTRSFVDVSPVKPEIDLVVPRPFLEEDKNKPQILINDLFISEIGASLSAGLYNHINFNIGIIIENISSRRVNDLAIQVEIPYQLCTDRRYYDKIKYRQSGNKFIFEFEISKISPTQSISTNEIYLHFDKYTINDTIEENIKVTVFTDDEPITRIFQIKETFKVKNLSGYQSKLIDKEMFAPKGGFF